MYTNILVSEEVLKWQRVGLVTECQYFHSGTERKTVSRRQVVLEEDKQYTLVHNSAMVTVHQL